MKKFAAFALVLGLFACGDDGGPATPAPDDTWGDTSPEADTLPVDDTFVAEDTLPPVDTVPAGPNQLRCADGVVGSDGAACVQTCSWNLTAGDERELAVVYRDALGQPRVDVAVKWSTDAPEGLARLSALSTYTGADGVARVTLRSFDLPGTAVVSARITSDPDAGEVLFTTTYVLPPNPVLLLSHEYVGQAGIASFSLRLFRDDDGAYSCGAIHPDAGGTEPTPDLTLGPYAFGQQARLMDLPDLATDGEQYWTAQFVGPDDAAVPKAVGCVDHIRVVPDATAAELVYILDLPPRFRGSYRAETRMDLVSGTSGTFGSIVSAIVQLFTEPGALVLKWACQNSSGTLGTVCDYLVDESGDPTIVGGVVVEAANAGFATLISSAVGSNVQVNGQTISEVLKDLRLLSDLGLVSEPSVPKVGFDGALFPAGDASEVWTHVRFRWKYSPDCKNAGNAQECGWSNMPLEEIYGFRPNATLEAGIGYDLDLHITKHEVPGLTYGPLVNAILEKKLLPLIFGDGTEGLPPIDSWDDLIATLLGDQYCLYYDDCCDYFAYRVEDNVPVWVAPFVPAACEAAIPAAANLIRNQISSLDGAMHVGTPVGDGCPFYDGNEDRWVDAWGNASAPCAWDLSFPYNGSEFAPDTDWRAIVQ